jgi:hypothetical protein
MHGLAAALGHHVEGLVRAVGSDHRRAEVLAVDLRGRQAGRRGLGHHPVHEARRAADIQVAAGRAAFSTAAGTSLSASPASSKCSVTRSAQGPGPARRGRRPGPAAGAVVQLEGGAQRMQAVGHRQHRRDADAAAHQHAVRRALVEREVVARGADGQAGASLQGGVHGHRAAARGGVLEHAQAVGLGVGRVAAQRVGRTSPPGRCRSTWAPAVKAGRALPSAAARASTATA